VISLLLSHRASHSNKSSFPISNIQPLMKYRLIFILLLPISVFAQNNRLYVNAAAAGANNGSNWADAFTDLNGALNAAQPGDSVWVAAGIYLPTADNTRDSSFRPPSGVRLYGGFAGNETTLDQRNWISFPTILSGDIGTPGDSTDNSYTIMYLDQPDSMTVVDGFVFRFGSATVTGGEAVTSHRRSGGALYIMGADGEAYAIIRHCRFERNRARSHGGAVYINGLQNGSVAPQFLDCVFQDNSAGTDGGAVYRNGSSWAERTPDFGHCTFEQNRAGRHGGGLYFQDAERTDTLQLDHCDFLNNVAEDIGGGSMLFTSRFVGSNVSIDNCVYEGNTAYDGAAFSVWSSGFSFTNSVLISNSSFIKNICTNNNIASIAVFAKSSNSLCKFSNIIFSENISGILSGSGIVSEISYDGNIFVENSIFKNNKLNAVNFLSISDSVLIFECTFEFNTVSNIVKVGGYKTTIVKNSLFNNKHFTNSSSSGIFLLQRRLQFIGENITFSVGEQLFFFENTSGGTLDTTSILVNNSILNEAQIFASKDAGIGKLLAALTNSALYNTAFTCADLPPGTCGPGMIEGIDPMFVNPDSGDFRLQPCSPLVNAGDNALVSPGNITDLAGNPRIAGGRVDLGAYETPVPNLAAEPVLPPACPGTNSGAAALEPENGCPPYQYAWSSSGGGNGSNLSGLPSGNYTVTVTDGRGSTFTVTFSIPTGNPTELALQAQAVRCGDTTGGSASATMLHATPPYTYQWSNAAADSLLTGLAAGYYLVTVTDALGCTADGIVEVTVSGSLDVQIIVEPITCPGAADGSLSVLPNTGKAPFAWVWENGPAGPTHAPLGPGTYLGTLTDALGCRIGWILPLSDPQAVGFQVNTVPASGPSAANGAAAIADLTGGKSPFSAIWSNGDTGFATDSLAPGQYSVTVTDANGCEKVAVFEVIFIVGTGQASVQERVQLFPNPASGRVRVVTTGPERVRLRVHDAPGRVMLDASEGSADLDVTDWPAGVYWVQVWAGEQLVAVKKLAVR